MKVSDMSMDKQVQAGRLLILPPRAAHRPTHRLA